MKLNYERKIEIIREIKELIEKERKIEIYRIEKSSNRIDFKSIKLFSKNGRIFEYDFKSDEISEI